MVCLLCIIKWVRNVVVRELSEDEKQMIILSEDFQRFIDRTGRIMERALAESVDIYTDYACMGDSEDGA